MNDFHNSSETLSLHKRPPEEVAAHSSGAPQGGALRLGSRGLTLVAIVSLSACALVACADGSANVELTNSQVAQPIVSQVGVERVIPIHYYVLDSASNTCTGPSIVNESVLYEGLREANSTFQGAGVQFTFAGMDRLTMPTFRDLRSQAGAATYSWSAVYTELQLLDPSLTSTTAPYATMAPQFNERWLALIANRLDPTVIPAMIVCSDNYQNANLHASFPDMDVPHTLHFGAQSIGFGFQRHELGHYFNLRHPDGVGGPASNIRNEEYDLVYGTNTANQTPQFFTSAAALNTFRNTAGAMIYRKEGRVDDQPTGNGGTGAFRAAYVNDAGTSNCELQITMGWGAYARTYRTSTDPAAMSGMQHAIAGAPQDDAGVPPTSYSTNIMSYLTCPRTGQEYLAIYDMEPSQIEQVRAALRSQVGQRDQLGRATVRQGPLRSAMVDPSGTTPLGSSVDFDGDHLHDIAYYRPSTSQCVVRLSSTGATQTITIANGNTNLGDIPMPGDYDNDGKTDCAVFRPGANVVGGATATWFWVSSLGGYVTQTSNFGWTGDIPIADVQFKPTTAGGYGRYGVFRPSNHTFYWWTSSGVFRGVSLGLAGDEMVLGDYDRDGYTDLAMWHPTNNTSGSPDAGTTPSSSVLAIIYSGDDYSSWHPFTWGLETDVPLGAVDHDNDGQLDFAVWRPSNGTWYYLLNPRANGTFGTASQQWGAAGDVPLPGFDLDHDGIDDEAIWRPAGSGAQLWYRNSATNTSSGYNVGLTGDVVTFVPSNNGDTRPEVFLFRKAGTPGGFFQEVYSSGTGYSGYSNITTSFRQYDILL